MSVFEQSTTVDIKDILFDSEFVLKFITADGREIFKVFNLPQHLLNDLINDSKESIPTAFFIEYKTPSLEHPLYIGMNGFQIEPFKFNTKYNKRLVVSKRSMVYRLGEKVGEIISTNTAKYSKHNSRFVQACILREFIPNYWVKDESSAFSMFSKIENKQVVDLEKLGLENIDSKQLALKDRLKIAELMGKKYPEYVNNNTHSAMGRFALTEIQSSYMLEHTFSFKNKTYHNWYDAFLDHIKRAERFYDGTPRPSLKSHMADEDKLKKVIFKISALEKQNTELRSTDISALNESEKQALSLKISTNIEQLSELRFKRKEFNVRSDRQLTLMDEKYLSCSHAKSRLIQKHLQDDILYLNTLRDELLKQRSGNREIHLKMRDVIKVNFKGIKVDGSPAVQGRIDFALNPLFINKLYSRNLKAFESVVKIVFELPDGKKVWHIPTYIHEEGNRVDTKGMLIHFDQTVFDWIVSQEQTRQNMIIQAVLNQHMNVKGDCA